MIGVSDFTFYFPFNAILLNCRHHGAGFPGDCVFYPKFIRKKEVVKLLKAETKDDKPQTLFPTLAVFLILTPMLLWTFAGQSVSARSMQESIFLPFLLIIVATLGTYLLFPSECGCG